MAFPEAQGPQVLYRLYTWGAYSNQGEIRKEIITNIEFREKIVLQIQSNKKPDPIPLVLGGAGAVVLAFLLGMAVK